MMPGSDDIPDALAEDQLRSKAEIDDALADAMFDVIADDTVDRKPHPLRDLRDLSTPRRVTIAIAVTLGAGAAGLAGMGLRHDFFDVLSARYLSSLAILGALATALLSVSLRGLHRAALGDALSVCLCGFGLTLPFLSAANPGWWPGTGVETDAIFHLRCFAQGGMLTAIVTAVTVLLMRADRPRWWRLVAAAAAGGLVGTLMQYLNCPSAEPFHLLTSHSALGAVVASAVLLADRLRYGPSE